MKVDRLDAVTTYHEGSTLQHLFNFDSTICRIYTYNTGNAIEREIVAGNKDGALEVWVSENIGWVKDETGTYIDVVQRECEELQPDTGTADATVDA